MIDDVPSVGSALAPYERLVTHSDIVFMSLATRDFHPVHHNLEVARALGHAALFLNSSSTAALIERFLLSAFEGRWRIRSLTLRLGAPHHAGRRIEVAGSVTASRGIGGDREIDITLQARNEDGVHASGTATLACSVTEP